MFDDLHEQVARRVEILAYVEQTIDFRLVFSSTSLACRYSGHLRTTNCRSLRRTTSVICAAVMDERKPERV